MKRQTYSHLVLQMMYLGMGGRAGENAADLFELKPRRRRGDKKHELTSRSTIHCAVFGCLAVGKSSLCKALAGRRYDEQFHGMLMAAGSVSLDNGEVKTLVLSEVSAPTTSGTAYSAICIFASWCGGSECKAVYQCSVRWFTVVCACIVRLWSWW